MELNRDEPMSEAEKKYIEELKKTHYLFNDINSNVEIWISKTKKINYNELHKIMALVNLRIYERQMEELNDIESDDI